VFVNKVHQLDWMAAGGARKLNALVPIEAKRRGGRIAGPIAFESGTLARAAEKGARRARQIAERWRKTRGKGGNDAS